MTFQAINHEDTLRPEGKTCILVYGFTTDEIDKIKKYTEALDAIPLIIIAPDKTLNTLDSLINENGSTSLLAEPINEHAIIFNAVSNYELNHFVHNFRSLMLPRPLFAMVTETSINWTFKALISDLCEERAMFEKMREKK